MINDVMIVWGLVFTGCMMVGMMGFYLSHKDSEQPFNITLDVLMLDRQIDYWRGQLDIAQHADDLESETIAMIHIDVYQELRIRHGLERLVPIKINNK